MVAFPDRLQPSPENDPGLLSAIGIPSEGRLEF